MQSVLTRAVWVMLACQVTGAEELPVRIYTMADGLARDEVLSIRRDSRGYLWFGTSEGLSIFDGNQFSNYTVADGLPQRAVHDVLETREGEYWIATYGGLCRFDSKADSGKRCIPYRFSLDDLARQVNRLMERRDGSIWAATEGGLWRLTRSGASFSAERIPLASDEGETLRVFCLAEDRAERLWVGTSDGVFVIGRTGVIAHLGPIEGLTGNVLDILADAQGRIWAARAARTSGISRIVAKGGGFAVGPFYCNLRWNRPYTSLFQTADGELWAGGMGLFEFHPEESDPERIVRHVAGSAPEAFVFSLGEDSDGNLWAGGTGAIKVTRHHFSRFSTSDGLHSLRIRSITQDRDGRVCAIGDPSTIQVFDGNRFMAVDAYLPKGFGYSWGDSQITFQDHAGDWWEPTDHGVLRFAAPARVNDLARTHPHAIYRVETGMPPGLVLDLFEDSRGDVWIGVYRGLARWDRATGRIQTYGAADGLPLVTKSPAVIGTPLCFAEDRRGDLWIGFYPNGLARYHGGRFQFYSESEGLPAGQVNRLYSDHMGRLWIATDEGGAARIDDVAAAHLQFQILDARQGLSSNQILAIVEDAAGRIYLGGGKGVDRIDPVTGSLRHFTAADGLPDGRVSYALRDRDGALWFASHGGLSRYAPEPDRMTPPSRPLIRGLRIAGKAIAVSDLGDERISGLRLGPAQNNLRIEFGSLNFRSGEVLRYQYRLRGADADWGPPGNERTVTLSGLAPGTYEFAVRALDGDGLTSAAASVAFVIVAPIWRRTWVIGIEASLLALGIYLAHWYRLRQILQVERIRTSLASDLHDDIGSGLAEIALLSEVAATQPRSAGEIAARLGDRARQLRQGMSEIVWSVDPRQRSLAELTDKIRQSAYSMLESNGRRVEFEAPDAGATSGVPVPPDRARQALLICREALTNIARHAGASEASVRMELKPDALLIDVRDNGRGFDPDISYEGMGLRNLRRRAEEAGGQLSIQTCPGKGTRVRAILPLK